MEDEEDRCSTKRCRGKPTVEFMGKPLCDRCWGKLCDKQTKEDIRLYKKMGLKVCLTPVRGNP